MYVLGLSRVTISKIKKEGQINQGVWRTPGKGKGSRPGRPKKVIIDDFDKCAIRHKINEYYAVRKQVPTLRKLLRELKQDIQFPGELDSLRAVLKNLGFKYAKCGSKRKSLCERFDIVAWRAKYLRTIKALRNEIENKKQLVFVDETYVHTSHSVNKCWQSDSQPGVSKDISLGERYIVVHAGSENGFISSALLVYKSKDKKADYHDDMNKDNFKKWFAEKLLPNLSGPSVIIMDNARYHCNQINKAPNQNNRKHEIQEWLLSNNISFPPYFTKSELLLLVKQHKPQPEYEIDAIAKENGHEILRTPPYHCDLNPIELIWSLTKRKIAMKNVNIEKKHLPGLIEQEFSSITADDWKKECDHIVNIENQYIERDRITEDLPQFIIHVENSSDDSSKESDINSLEMSGVEYLESDFDYES